MAKKILLGMWLMLACVSFAKAQTDTGIHFFEGTWEEALQKAKKENKLIFVDCYGPGCGACTFMEKNIFPLKEVGDFYNKHFINLKRDVVLNEEGKMLAKKFIIQALPTYLFVNAEGYLTSSKVGSRPAEQFVAIGQEALDNGNASDDERFVKGERDDAFVKGYIRKYLDISQVDKVQSILDTIYKESGVGILQDAEYWEFFYRIVTNVEHPLFVYMLNHRKEFYKLYGKDHVDQIIQNRYARQGNIFEFYDWAGRRKPLVDEEKKKAYFDKIKALKLPDYKGLQQELEFQTLLRLKKYDEALAYGDKYLKKTDAREWCNWLILCESLGRDPEFRLKAAQWAKPILDLEMSDELRAECENIDNDLMHSKSPNIKSMRRSVPPRGKKMLEY